MNDEGEQVLTVEGLTAICPVILQQVVSGACDEVAQDSERSPVDDTYTEAKSRLMHFIKCALCKINNQAH